VVIFENISQGILVGLEVIILVAALGVVLIPNIVYSAFLLAVVLIAIAGLYILLNAEFLAAAQILIYVGAINVLILFAIMLVNSRLAVQSDSKPLSVRLLAVILSFGSFAGVSSMIVQTSWPKPPFLGQPQTMYLIGNHLFSDYLLPFEVVSLILLIALIGAVLLARKEKKAKLASLDPLLVPSTLPSDLPPPESLNLLGKGNIIN
jgi:NAD(P)H-quinone oxidoreductase subunit 6